jgi:hypothetical protein
MDRTKLFAVGTALVALAVLFALFQGFGTGLFGLSEKPESMEEPLDSEQADGMNAGLSFEVLKPTRLEASLVSKEPLSECPREAEAEITVKNTGTGTAEKMFLRFGPGIRVIGCNNCTLDEIIPGQEVKAKARLCLESGSLQALTVGSANSNSVELRFD